MSWTHKVVKRMRGADGEWFDFPTASTFRSEAAARAYAAAFAAEQRAAGIRTFRIDVRSRAKVLSPNGFRVYTIHTEFG